MSRSADHPARAADLGAPQPLSLNAQFMAPARIELSQCFALLELAPPPRQLLGGENRDREVNPVADEIVWWCYPMPAIQT